VGSFLEQRFQSPTTRSMSELLILGVISRLGPARLSEIHQALRDVTQGSETVFFVGQPLRKVLEHYRDLRQVNVTREVPEPTYELTPAARVQVQQLEGELGLLFPQLRQLHRPR
jgi:hypothetical protein